MLLNYILLLSCILLVFSLYNNSLTFTKQIETFDSTRNCLKLGYNLGFCLDTPLETNGPCYCPSGKRPYVRYGRCYCRTYL